MLTKNQVVKNPCKEDLWGRCGPISSINQVYEQQPSLLTPVWDRREGLPKLGLSNISYSLEEIEVSQGEGEEWKLGEEKSMGGRREGGRTGGETESSNLFNGPEFR
jgi:hypothetical protein